jgi:hypothetical protein
MIVSLTVVVDRFIVGKVSRYIFVRTSVAYHFIAAGKSLYMIFAPEAHVFELIPAT